MKWDDAVSYFQEEIGLDREDAEDAINILVDHGMQFAPEKQSAVEAFNIYADSLGIQTGNDLRELAYAMRDELQAQIDNLREGKAKQREYEAEIARLKEDYGRINSRPPESPELVKARELYYRQKNQSIELEAVRSRLYIAELEKTYCGKR